MPGIRAANACRWTALSPQEMLTSFREHEQLILGNASDFVQPDAPRVGGISPFPELWIWQKHE